MNVLSIIISIVISVIISTFITMVVFKILGIRLIDLIYDKYEEILKLINKIIDKL